MPRSRPPYPAEFRARIIELARAGRSPEDLAKEFEPCSHTIRSWLAAAGRTGVTPSRPASGLDADEREEIQRLRRENRQLRQERDILAKALDGSTVPRTVDRSVSPWFARSDATSPRSSGS
jgi:transposase